MRAARAATRRVQRDVHRRRLLPDSPVATGVRHMAKQSVAKQFVDILAQAGVRRVYGRQPR
jgi:hypothetical protein